MGSRTTIVYSYPDDYSESGVGATYTRTLAEAREGAKALAKEEGSAPIPITRHTVEVSASIVVRLLNHEGWCAESVVIESWQRKACGKCDACAEGDPSGCSNQHVVKIVKDNATSEGMDPVEDDA